MDEKDIRYRKRLSIASSSLGMAIIVGCVISWLDDPVLGEVTLGIFIVGLGLFCYGLWKAP
ncbi:uncharacterized protein HHUB_3485 [Halobacterium hubeiense]|jgi:hypothetical protein|uniref:Uncharacterized protein n=1 Tax=Halobacterium hubeiense TaxID=1407499 RepID=A0A0U5H3A8_9EURY|nr:uncharacterized protein HHUB_3485 [Halobacterium hubeiense]